MIVDGKAAANTPRIGSGSIPAGNRRRPELQTVTEQITSDRADAKDAVVLVVALLALASLR